MLLSEANGYSSSFYAYWSTSKIKYVDKYPKQFEYDYIFQGPGPGCTFLLDKELFCCLQKFVISNFNEVSNVYYHDWFIYAYARSRSFKWFIDSKSYIYYRQHSNNDTGVNLTFKSIINRISLIYNKFAFEQISLIAKLLGYEEKLSIFFRFPLSIFLVLPHVRKYRRDCLGRIALSLCVLFNLIKKS